MTGLGSPQAILKDAREAEIHLKLVREELFWLMTTDPSGVDPTVHAVARGVREALACIETIIDRVTPEESA